MEIAAVNMTDPARFIKDKHRIAANFSKAAAGYNSFAQFQQTVGERLLENLPVMNIRPGWFADLGSGTGRVTENLLKVYPGSRGLQIDLATDMLRHARPRWPWQRRRANWVCADAECLPIKEASLDMIVSNLMLQWCNEPGRVMEEAYRALRPGGLLIFSTLGPDTLQELRESWDAVDDAVHVNAFMDIHAVGTALAAMGFSGAVLGTEKFTLTYDDGKALMRDLKRLGTGNTNAGRARALTGKGRLAGMLQHYESFRYDGKLPATYEVIYAHAWREEKQLPRARGTVAIPVSAIGRR